MKFCDFEGKLNGYVSLNILIPNFIELYRR